MKWWQCVPNINRKGMSMSEEIAALRTEIARKVGAVANKNMRKPMNTQMRAEVLADVIEIADALIGPAGNLDGVALEDAGGKTPYWDAVWELINHANTDGKTLLAMYGDVLGLDVRCESGDPVGLVTGRSQDTDGRVCVVVGSESFSFPPNYGHPKGHFPKEYYFRKSGSDAYDWAATAELLRDFASQPVKVAA